MPHEVDDALCINETPAALLIELCSDGGREVWVPKSVIDSASEVWGSEPKNRGPGVLIVRTWFAEKEGLP